MVPIAYNVRSLAVRRTTTVATAFGIALVVFVLASSLMLGYGIQRTMGTSGRPYFAVVLRKGSDAELPSNIENRLVSLVLAAPGVARDSSGAPLGAGEVVIVIALDKSEPTAFEPPGPWHDRCRQPAARGQLTAGRKPNRAPRVIVAIVWPVVQGFGQYNLRLKKSR